MKLKQKLNPDVIVKSWVENNIFKKLSAITFAEEDKDYFSANYNGSILSVSLRSKGWAGSIDCRLSTSYHKTADEAISDLKNRLYVPVKPLPVLNKRMLFSPLLK